MSWLAIFEISMDGLFWWTPAIALNLTGASLFPERIGSHA
jgi:hypothetical protein